MTGSNGRRFGGIGFLPLALLAIVVVLGALVAGCGGSSDSTSEGGVTQSTTTDQKTSEAEIPVVNWAFPGEPIETISLLSGLAGAAVSQNVGEGLVAMDAEGHLHNAVASKWTRETPTSYVYTLRKGMRFSNGKPVTMDDVLYSLNSVIDPKTGGPFAGFFPNIKEFTADGAGRIKMTLDHPDASASYYLSSLSNNIYEKAAAENAGSTPGEPSGIPVGTGPYKVTEIGPESTTLVRNPYYAGEKPKAAKIVVHFIADNSTRLAALESGEIDGTFMVPATETPRWEKSESFNMLSVPSALQQAFRFNLHRKPFDDLHARRAVMYAFDREGVIEKILHGNARVANALIQPEMWANEGLTAAEVEARSGELGQQYPYDPEKAEAELAKSKYPNGFSTSVTYNPSGNQELALAMQVMQQNLKQVGINLKLNPVSEAQMVPEYTAAEPKYEILGQFGAPGYPSAASAGLNEVLCSCLAPPNGTMNTGYDNPSLNKEIEAATIDPNPETRADKVFKIMAVSNRDIPFPTIWWSNAIAAVSNNLVLKEFGPWTELQTPWMANIYAAGE